MNLTILTLFPEPVEAYFASSIMAKAVARGLVSYRCVNIRDFAVDTHRTCDDAPYGGGAGMVLKPGPLAAALDSVDASSVRTVYPTPSGIPLRTPLVHQLAAERELILVCGRYEGIDQRIIDRYVDDEISIGDYVLSSGELAALVIIDAVYRRINGVITAESLDEESFEDGLLEYPHYTRPETFASARVPEVLLSGHHEQIRAWRMEQRIAKTRRMRPDLYQAWLAQRDDKE
ncbi:MAG: tRNA (guanosine(37)-N1)-methyltransferase TrmD [Spirochaetaceae bacterium]|nr:MAG: tRNA (guanosine(37)-N1)-methyltransferase TrmD [Spirochaetaceae bacterium]